MTTPALGSARIGSNIPSLLSGYVNPGSATGSGGGTVLAWSVGPYVYNQYTDIQSAITDAELVATSADPVVITVEEGTYGGFTINGDNINIVGKGEQGTKIHTSMFINGQNIVLSNLALNKQYDFGDNAIATVLNCSSLSSSSIGTGVGGTGNITFSNCYLGSGVWAKAGATLTMVGVTNNGVFDLAIQCGAIVRILSTVAQSVTVDLSAGIAGGSVICEACTVNGDVSVICGSIDDNNYVKFNGGTIFGNLVTSGSVNAPAVYNVVMNHVHIGSLSIQSGPKVLLFDCYVQNGGHINSNGANYPEVHIEGGFFAGNNITINGSGYLIDMKGVTFVVPFDNAGGGGYPSLSAKHCRFLTTSVLGGVWYECIFEGTFVCNDSYSAFEKCTFVGGNVDVPYGASFNDCFFGSDINITAPGGGVVSMFGCTMIGHVTSAISNAQVEVRNSKFYYTSGFVFDNTSGAPGSTLKSDSNNITSGDTVSLASFSHPDFAYATSILTAIN